MPRRKRSEIEGVKLVFSTRVDAEILHEFREAAIEWFWQKRGRRLLIGAMSEATEKAMRLFIEAWRRGELDYE